MPATESEGVSLAGQFPAAVIDPLEVLEARFVVELDPVEHGTHVASLRNVGDVVQKLGETGVGSAEKSRI